MYSGSDSTESLKNQKWPTLNPLYPNASNEHIDWAALAQQWIIMKEAGPPIPEINPPSPPPPPNIREKDSLSEGGEAPMEVENEKEDLSHSNWNEDVSSAEGSWNWNQQQHWGYSWSSPVQASMASKAPLLPTPSSYNQYSAATADVTPNFQLNNKSTTSPEYAGRYWTASETKSKPHNKRFSKVNVPTKQASIVAAETTDHLTLDANRRKQLPAWIRDGLEKMERDKLKQLEKEKEKQENKDVESTKTKFNEKEALEIIKSTVKERERSKFDSDGDDSNNEIRNRSRKRSTPEPVMISHEELMLKIRKTMTEILLKVTSQEIVAVCKEEYQRRLRKRKASDHHVSASSGTTITSKLGVGIYGGESGSSTDDSGSDSDQESIYSEAALKATIRRRKAEFVKIERDIEERLAAAENPTDDVGRAGTPDIYESQVDTKYQDPRLKLGNAGVAASPKYVPVKHILEKVSSSNSSGSDSDYSDKRNGKIVQNQKTSNSDSILNQKHGRDYLYREGKSQTPEKMVKQQTRYGTESKHADSYAKTRRTRSKSPSRRNRSRSRERYRDYKSSKTFSKRSRSPSSSRSYRSMSYGQSEINGRRSDSYSKNRRSRKSRSRSRSRHRKSVSSERSSHQSRKSGSRRKSRSFSPEEYYYRRSRSRSSSRGKRSHRH